MTVTLPVIVNTDAAPGGFLHNVAELWGKVWVSEPNVSDPNDPNTFHEEDCLLATAEIDTDICCWQDSPEELFVDKNALDGGNGIRWDVAYNNLQDALEYARSAICGHVSTIYVAQGIYSPGDDENDSFKEPNNISLYGGFPTGGCDPNLRDPKKYVTTLTGYIDETTRNTTVVTMGANSHLEGFTVTNADYFGQGILGLGVDFSISTCNIDNNEYYGIYAENGNVTLEWCKIQNNKADGIRHTGEDKLLILKNCSVRQSGRYGIACTDSTPSIINSTIIESDVAQEGRSGLFMEDPTGIPYIQNCTIAHNKAAGLDLLGDSIPIIQNTIVYHNGGPALAGFTADEAASYCCIEDCNPVNNNHNINVDPEFAYFDPNNVRIKFDSPCHDTGLTLTENYTQVDMDNRDRVLGAAVDRGAYEIDCEDTDNALDWNSDGLINLYEFNSFSKAWLTYDPNNPLCDPNNPNYVSDPNAPGYIDEDDKLRFNPACDLNNDLAVDLGDLILFCEDSPQVWLWRACWLTDEELAARALGSEQLSVLSNTVQTEAVSTAVSLSASAVSTGNFIGTQEVQAVTESVVEPELSVEEQIDDLKDSIEFLERIWQEEPDIQNEINPADWQEFMEAVHNSLLELQTEAVEIE